MDFIKKFTSEFKSEEDQEKRRNEKIIDQTQEKMNQLVSSVNNEIQMHKSVMRDLHSKIGAIIYEMYKESKLTIELSEELKNLMNELSDNEEQVYRLDLKMKSIRERYEEELEILRKFQPISHEKIQSTNECCKKCGSAINEGDLFCINCGQKVE